MHKIAVYFSKAGIDEYPFDKEYYRIAYRELAEELEKRGAKLYVVRGKNSYIKNNWFTHAWEFDGEWFAPLSGIFEAELIYDKGVVSPQDENISFDAGARLLNHPEMDAICTDKSRSYALFPDLHPATLVVSSAEEIFAALNGLPGEKIVIKPLDGEEGRGVQVIEKKDVMKKITVFPYLIQQFIDTSAGIPGIVASMHDLRIIVINGEAVLSFVRTPPEGSYLANVAQGGKKIEVDIENIPPGALAIKEKVDVIFSRYRSRVYSIDMGRNSDGTWKIIELNSKPGCTCKSEGPGSTRFQQKLADALVRAAQAPATM